MHLHLTASKPKILLGISQTITRQYYWLTGPIQQYCCKIGIL